jgi:putative ATP-dependent endonuclease of the OLD family
MSALEPVQDRTMRISAIKIENFRAFKNETVEFADYTSLIGPNGAGKSTVLTALRVFFRDTADTVTDLQSLTEEDFNNKNTREDVVITVVFEDLSEEAKTDLQHYYRHGKLVVSAVAHWNPETNRAEVLQYGERLGMQEFVEFFEAEKDRKSASDLVAVYARIRERWPELPSVKAKQQMVDALREFETANPKSLVPIRSTDQFYGFTRGESLLGKHVQWIYVPAVKDSSTENREGKNNALRTILERTVRSRIDFEAALAGIRDDAKEKYRNVLASQQKTLKEISVSLSSRMSTWAHPDAGVKVQWDDDTSKYIRVEQPVARVTGREGEFEGDLSRFGHGFQRSYLLALLQELSGCLEVGGPKLILGCEEPEIHQHPPQARHMAEVLELLSSKNAQIIVASHSPFFVRGLNFDDVRFVRYDRQTGTASVKCALLKDVSKLIAEALGEEPIGLSALAMKIEQSLQENLKEMFFSPALVLVEGREDIGFLESYISLLGIKEVLHSHGCNVVSTNGKNEMLRPLVIAKLLGIPTFVIFDADGNEKTEANKKQNLALLRILSVQDPEPFPAERFMAENVCVWPIKIKTTVCEEIGQVIWDNTAAEIAQDKGVQPGLMAKNQVFLGQVLCATWIAESRSKSLQDVCKSIMSFAIRNRGAVARVLDQ